MLRKKILILLSFTLLSSPLLAAEVPERRSDFAQKSKQLKAKAQKRKKIPVIIRLKAPFKPEGKINKAEIRKQRRFIQRIRGTVRRQMQDMMDADESILEFEKLPYIALRITPKRMERLMQSPYVVSIKEDIPLWGKLDTSVPLTNSNTGFAQGYSGAGQTIAVIDSGVRLDHEFFAGKIISEACYSGAGIPQESLCPNQALSSIAPGSGNDCDLSISGCGHGTHVAGIAVGNNAQFSGIAKDAKLITIKTASKITNQDGSSFISHFNADLASALTRIYDLREQHNIAAVNLSIGNSSLLEDGTCDNINPIITDAINLLKSVNIATVISSGNTSQTNRMTYPACISSAISVGNSVSELQANSPSYRVDDVWFDSNISATTDLLAPGTKILSAGSGSATEYFENWGTSMAAPHVAGAFAVLRAKNPEASVDTLLAALKDGGLPRLDQRRGGIHTVPRIDIANALSFIQPAEQKTPASTVPTPEPPAGGEVNTTTPALTWSATPNTETYVINGWSGDGPLTVDNQIIGKSVSARAAGCAAASANSCTFTFKDQPFPNNQTGNWMVRAGTDGQDSAPVSFKVNATNSSDTPVVEPKPLTPSNGKSVNTLTPELRWTAQPGAVTYILNAWTGEGPINSATQVIGHVVYADSANCGQPDATSCSYTFTRLPFPNNTQANWMVRAGDRGPDSEPATFTVSAPDIADTCAQGSTPVIYDRIRAGQPLCLRNIAPREMIQLHIYVNRRNSAKRLKIQTAHGVGNATLTHRHGRRPNTRVYDTTAELVAGSAEEVNVSNLARGWHYIHFTTKTQLSGMTLLVDFE